MRSRGFTLIELLVVVAIVALLSSIVLASLNTARAKARDAQRASDIRQLANAVALYQSDNGGSLPNALKNTDAYTEPYYANVALGTGMNLNFYSSVAPYIQPLNDPLWAVTPRPYYYYVIRPSATWITNNSWSRLTSACIGKPVIVAIRTETSGKFRQDCAGAGSDMIIISAE